MSDPVKVYPGDEMGWAKMVSFLADKLHKGIQNASDRIAFDTEEKQKAMEDATGESTPSYTEGFKKAKEKK